MRIHFSFITNSLAMVNLILNSTKPSRNYLCWFVLGLNCAIAVSVNGAKNISPPYGLAPKPIPCDDFLPTSFTGNSFPTGSGPARKAVVETENNLTNIILELNISVKKLSKNNICLIQVLLILFKALNSN